MKTISTVLLGLALTIPLIAQEKPTTADMAIASRVTNCAVQGTVSDADAKRECEKRDTARLFLIAGKPDAALRILCDTSVAIEGFREPGSNGKYEENVAAIRKCQQSVGVEGKR